jgi:hypothetical protein
MSPSYRSGAKTAMIHAQFEERCQRNWTWPAHHRRVGSHAPRSSPFRYLKTSPEIIRLAVMLYIGVPLSLRNVEDLLQERGMARAVDHQGEVL